MAKTTKKNAAAQAPAPEAQQTAQEAQGDVQDAQAQEAQQEAQEAAQEAQEQFTPYEATVAVPLVVIRRGSVPRPEDKPIGTVTSGARVTVTAIMDGYAMLDNGTYVKADYLSKRTPEN